MTITDERKKAIDFSDPYFDATAGPAHQGQALDSLDALNGKSLGVMSGTTGEVYAKEQRPRRASSSSVRGPRPADHRASSPARSTQ